MLSCAGFYQLPYSQQADLLFQQGTFIQSRSEENFVIDLYELQDLLIEIYYGKENEELISVMAYNTQEKLKTLKKGALQPRLVIKTGGQTVRKESYAA